MAVHPRATSAPGGESLQRWRGSSPNHISIQRGGFRARHHAWGAFREQCAGMARDNSEVRNERRVKFILAFVRPSVSGTVQIAPGEPCFVHRQDDDRRRKPTYTFPSHSRIIYLSYLLEEAMRDTSFSDDLRIPLVSEMQTCQRTPYFSL